MDPINPWLMIAWITLHVGAVMAAWGTRVSIGSRIETFVQLAFFGALGAVGLIAVVGHHLEVSLWALSVGTLIVMILTAVVDFRRTHEPAHLAYHASGR